MEYNPFARDTQINPYPVYRWLRDEAPVYHNPEVGFWALSRFDDVLNGLHDPATYTSTEGVALEHTDAAIKSMIELDPPDHTQMRKLIARRFTPSCGASRTWVRRSRRLPMSRWRSWRRLRSAQPSWGSVPSKRRSLR